MPTMMLLLQTSQNTPTESKLRELLDQVLTFLYSLAHLLGGLVAQGIEAILNRSLPADLTDPLGFLVIITIFLIITEVAKKIAWIVIALGWILIILRIVLEVLTK